MNRFVNLLLNRRLLIVLGLLALAAFLFLGASALEISYLWPTLALLLLLVCWMAALAWRAWRAPRAAQRIEQDIEEAARRAQERARTDQERAQMQALREGMRAAIRKVRDSRLGQARGRSALYELPWYIVVGNPSAGKSTAIMCSGLDFPLADGQGAGEARVKDTRNCDWFFTSGGILLDTAGRYAVHGEDRAEWFGLLDLLRRVRPKAPINGVLVVVSIDELTQARPDATVQLANDLRQRVQEVTDRLGVMVPMYLVFTKCDLVAGFAEFFADRDEAERQAVWGATMPIDAGDGGSTGADAPAPKRDAATAFDAHFDDLCAGLKEQALARMTVQRSQALPLAVLSFPLEFAALKPALRSFVATLFKDNPYQYQPLFRGFYFTSATQQGTGSARAAEMVAARFALDAQAAPPALADVASSFFLRDLFARVIFVDRHLVRRHTTRNKQRWRTAAFAGAVLALAGAVFAWATSYVANQQLLAHVVADLDRVVKVQTDRIDLASRIEAMEVLQGRIEQLAAWRRSRPLGVGFGLYQGEELDRRLRAQYFAGLQQIMVEPVAESIEAYLAEVIANADKLEPTARMPASGSVPPGGSRFVKPSPTSVEEAYNALKTYLMLQAPSQESGKAARAGVPQREAGHLGGQLPRFWRAWLDDNRGTMPQDKLVGSAERMVSFALANLDDLAFPRINANLLTVDRVRESLRRVIRGVPARERVYAEIKARGNASYPSVTVAQIAGGAPGARVELVGSHVVPGVFTRSAWNQYVEAAIKSAAGGQLQGADWVLDIAGGDDILQEGSPDLIRKELTDLYKREYVAQWQQFVRQVSVAEVGSFDEAVAQMNQFGDATDSPLRRVLVRLFDETSWDNPSFADQQLARGKTGAWEWIRTSVLRLAPAQVELKVDVSGKQVAAPAGPIGREFAGLARIMAARDNAPTVLAGYLQALGKVRAGFNAMKMQGDAGEGARKAVVSTLEGGNASDLAEALRYVQEQMLAGMSQGERDALRPMLVRPLMQAFAALIAPLEAEINLQWRAQVLQPFGAIAGKYPFEPASQDQATAAEINRVFGPEGAIAKFGAGALGLLVQRRGSDDMAARKWADIGVRLRPEFVAGFGRWAAPLEGAAAAVTAAAGTQAAPAGQLRFRILPLPPTGLDEYTIEIDGQILQYRPWKERWAEMVWPNPSGQPGARITGVTRDGRTVEVFNAQGSYGFDKMIELALPPRPRPREPDRSTRLTWSNGAQSVTVQLRRVDEPGPAQQGADSGGGIAGLRGLRLPALAVGADGPVVAVPAAAAAAASAALR